MKKLILFILLFVSVAAIGQKAGRTFTGRVPPTGRYANFDLTKDIYCDTVAKKYYISKVADVWHLAPGYGSGTGGGGLNSFTIGTVTTGATGTPADATLTGTVNDPILNLTLPRGATGATGATGGGSGSSYLNNSLTSPDKYGALHANTTFAGAGYNQTQVDSGWGAAGALTTDMVDWGAWQMAIIEATSEGNAITAFGEYFINRNISIPKVFRTLTIIGNKCILTTTNSNAFTVLGRVAPANQSEALNQMVASVYNITDICIRSQSANLTQVGFESGPNENSTFSGIWVTGMYHGMHLRFSLNTMVRVCQVHSCYKGITADIGNWTGADNSNSQSNVTTISNCRLYVTDALYGIGIYGSSGCTVENSIVEGSQCINGIDYDALGSTNVYSFWVKNLHMECNYDAATGVASSSTNSLTTGSKTFTVPSGSYFYATAPVRMLADGNGYMEGTVTSYSGTTLIVNITSVVSGSGTYSAWHGVVKLGCVNSAIKVRALGGIFVLDGAYGQYPSILMDVEGTLSDANVEISHIFSWFSAPFLGVNKMFRKRGTAGSWLLNWNDQMYAGAADAPNRFTTNPGTGGTAGVIPPNRTWGVTGQGNGTVINCSPR